MNLEGFYLIASIFLLVTVLLSLTRVVAGPTPAARMLGVQLFGTTGIGLLFLIHQWAPVPGVEDVALVLAMLAAVAMVTFVQTWRMQEKRGSDS